MQAPTWLFHEEALWGLGLFWFWALGDIVCRAVQAAPKLQAANAWVQIFGMSAVLVARWTSPNAKAI